MELSPVLETNPRVFELCYTGSLQSGVTLMEEAEWIGDRLQPVA